MRKGLCSEVDDDEADQSKGLLKIVCKKSGQVYFLARKTPEGLYEVSVPLRHRQTALISLATHMKVGMGQWGMHVMI